MKFYPKKLISNLTTLAISIMFVWGFISYCEIIIKNVNPNPTYSSWNIIVNACNYAEENICK